MPLHPLLINGEWRQAQAAADSFSASNPTTGEALAEVYPVSGWQDIEEMVAAGQEAAVALRQTSPETIAAFLERYAGAIEARADQIAQAAHEETGLPLQPRLRNGEMSRTVDQLRQAAAAARERSWSQATIDSEANIRSRFEALGGPVVVMGPNNFPLAFNAISGGDFAAAIAAGNPVIAKAHPGHPTTTRLLAEAACEALQESDAPPAMVQLFYHIEPEDGLRLVADDRVKATAFTGSRRAGMALKRAAEEAGNLIYLEMSSVNPVFILPGALAERGAEIAAAFYASCTMGTGQFCTNPGLVIVQKGARSEAFLDEAQRLFAQQENGVLLAEGGVAHLVEAVAALQDNGAELLCGGQPAEGPGYRFQNTLLRASGEQFLADAEGLQTEAFGPASVVVFARDAEQMVQIAEALEGNLTAGIYSASGEEDEALYERLSPVLREKVGRLLNDKMPTGVAVTAAMVHGGPYPATGHPGFTAVGIPAALLRFAARRSYDNVRHHRLPVELQNENPTGEMWRYVDGRWTQGDV
ncbi:MAG TPA: aldehyde dehydrogenase (NADP(+)) [Candidatus Sulfomarinibacteraceae bacterium]|nr:aldehyde dehydrogenase (NADP(+)) [Candidatus Sulfomarinibacteraceae bacterium]